MESMSLSNSAFEADFEKLLGLYRELHRELTEDLFAKAVHNEIDCVFLGETSLTQVENLVFGDLGGCSFVLHFGA
jgi:hypothetical protein